LIRRAVLAGYEVLLTADRNLPEQQNIRVSGVAVLLVPGDRLAEIAPHRTEIDRAIREARPGAVVRVLRLG